MNSLVTVGEVNTNRASDIIAGTNCKPQENASGENSPYGVPVQQLPRKQIIELDPLKIQIKSETDEAEAIDFEHPFSPVTCTRDLGENDDIDELTKLMRLQSDGEHSPN